MRPSRLLLFLHCPADPRRARVGGRAAHRAARRDAVVDRGGEQPHDPDRRRLQRPVRGRPGRARVDDPGPDDGRGLRRAAAGGARAGLAGRRRARRRSGRGRRPPRVPRRPRAPTRCAPATRCPRSPRSPACRSSAMAAMNGLDPAGVLLTGTVLKLPSGAPAPAQASDARTRRRRSSRPRRPPPTSQQPHGRRHPERRRRPRRLPLAGRRDRLAGERLQQRHGLRRQRARRHAGDARHVGLRAAEPRRRPAARPELGDRQRPRRRDVPQAPDRRRRAATRTRRSPATTRASPRSATAACSTTRSSTSTNVQALRSRFGG